MRERTEKVAYELYQNRLLLKRQGDALKDWTAAEEIVQSPLKAALFAVNRAFIKLEKRAWEPLLTWANNQALLSLLGLIGNAGIIIAVLTYVGSEKQRREAEVLNAWQTITSAHGQAGSGGRIQALEFLNASPGANWRRRFPWFCAPLPLCTWPAESLDGVNLTIGSDNNSPPDEQSTSSDGDRTIVSPARVYLAQIQLPGASLISANLESANLQGANLEG
ncbi:MAG: pentapeptide repeat-containing protein, partial [Pseudanabaenales cyanobacterium]|nr:pentapeptide repeat-containing protein [Pseudanabaenales cyanobacterium]